MRGSSLAHKASMKLTLNEEKKESRCCNIILHIKAIFLKWFYISKATFVFTVLHQPLVFMTIIIIIIIIIVVVVCLLLFVFLFLLCI